jgi:hypothetical protein
MFLWITGNHLQDNMVWQSRQPQSTSSLPSEPQISEPSFGVKLVLETDSFLERKNQRNCENYVLYSTHDIST